MSNGGIPLQQNLYKRGLTFALILIVICFGFSVTGFAKQDDLQVVKIQLRWDNQFQFAGYYAADWQGYYAEEGIKIEIIPAIRSDQSIVSSIEEVSEGRADFGIGSSDILIANDRGADLRVVAVIMQRSAARYFLKKETPYAKLSDLIDLRVARNVNDLVDIELQAMLINEGIDPNLVKAYPHQAGIDNFMSNNVQVLPGYELGIPYIAQQEGISIKEINPQEYGVDFYGDSLFASGKLVDQTPELVEKFKRASLKGWEYAFNNSEEIATRISRDLVNYEKYNDLIGYNMYQAHIMKELAEYPIVEVGHINPYRWQKMSTFLKSVGLIENEADISKLIFDPVKYNAEKEKQRNDILINLGLSAFVLMILVGLWVFFLRRTVKRKIAEILKVQSNLTDSEKKYKLITDNASDVISVYNFSKMKFTYVSPSILALRGLTVEEALSEKLDDAFTPDFIEHAIDTISKNTEDFTNNPKTTNSYLDIVKQPCKNGKIIWVEISTKYQYNPEGELESIHISRNIDERKKTEDQIRNDENRFREVLQNLDAGVVVHAPDTSIIDCNKRAEDLLGLSKEHLLGVEAIDPLWLFLREDGTQLPHEEFPVVLVINNKKPIRDKVLCTYQPDSGCTNWLTVNGTPIYNQLGEITEVVISFTDITERKNAEDLLNVQMKDLLESQRIAHIGTWRLTLATNEVVWSEELYKMFGFSPLLPVPPYTEHMKLFTPESWDILSTSLESTRTTGVPYELELEVVKKDGTNGWIWVRGEAERDSQGNIVYLWGAMQNITERKQVEAELVEAIEVAEAANAAKGQFLANMSHEIRTPLNGVMGMLQLMQMTGLSEEQMEYLKISKTSSDLLLKVINDILDYSKIESGNVKIEKQRFILKELIEEVNIMFKPSTQNKGLVLEYNIDDNISDNLIGDPFRLRQILSNIVGNAIKFTSEGTISITVKEVEEMLNKEIKLEFRVKDTGIGINEYKINDIFNSFAQADSSTTRQYGGTGLGLSICKGLVKKMKGEIWVESIEGEGSSFFFTCVLGKFEKDNETVLNKIHNVEEIIKEDCYRLLIVEDDAISRMVMEQFARRKGWQTIVAKNGKQAIDAYQDFSFDAILMDVQMPVMDGYQATGVIRKLESEKGTYTPIIAMTAFALKGDRERCLEAGMNDYLSKPVDVNDFYAAVEKWTKNISVK